MENSYAKGGNQTDAQSANGTTNSNSQTCAIDSRKHWRILVSISAHGQGLTDGTRLGRGKRIELCNNRTIRNINFKGRNKCERCHTLSRNYRCDDAPAHLKYYVENTCDFGWPVSHPVSTEYLSSKRGLYRLANFVPHSPIRARKL